ncbi:uncharacterized protein PHACADRAFT_208208 [Phanerochaete carnosa HHB-10118-sp]|uniref:Carrier domain-containing protein n=1 Tax=Phanerochaete carnosa (strain HHB-10118-sp) TaxID=650164 RepID=K5V3A6_PHACS|nr:uncharacterized protein PHACADRAFT_208208 [Phanerochaete carnosa HHB-10118-sp]EKM57056.1 hypothetical protein PHACADRAFT_208208 [Phanerochaete carnosa HHB-10118-sp]
MSDCPAFPPLDGLIPVLPGFADFHAEHNADKPWVLWPSQEGSKPGSISFLQFANATHRIAHMLRPNRGGPEGEVVAILINCDSVLYLALIVGLVRAGFVPFPMSPRNGIPAILNMLEITSCHRIISQPEFAPLVSAVKTQLGEKQYGLGVDSLPGLLEIFPDLNKNGRVAPCTPYPRASKPHDMEDIVLYLHSSGSTGLPRAIPQRQINILHWCNSDVLLDWRHKDVLWGVMPLPTFHTFAFMMQLYAPLVNGRPVGLYAPRAPAPPPVPSPKNVLDACRALRCNAIAIVPAFIETWAKSAEDVQYLASLRFLGYAGGPLSAETGSRLHNAGVKLCAGYGATEFGNHTRLLDADDSQGPDAPVKTSADWQWFTFSDYVKLRWVPEGDGTYELQFLTCPTHRPSVENLPDTRGYATKDLWIPHPSKSGLWKIVGRKDDVIVLGAGEKVVPLPQEGVLNAHSAVTGAVMFGRGRAQCGVLVEVGPGYEGNPQDPVYVERTRDLIWPAVQEANAKAPAFARVFKEMILVADPGKPLPRAAKSTVIRKQALDLYEVEIEQLQVYESAKESAPSDGIPPPASWSSQDIEQWLVELCTSIKDGSRISASKDIFNQGFDSLHAAALRNRIIGALRSSADPSAQDAVHQVSQNFVFSHPTLRKLANAISQLVNEGQDSARRTAVEEVQMMLDTYSRDLPTPIRTHSISRAGAVVLLTGSTGNVGSHMLTTLLQEPAVHRVYTLNRPSAAAKERQRKAFAERGLPIELLSSNKLVQLFGNATDERLGLEQVVFDELKLNVTHVIHNAWRVDFNLSLPSFETHVSGTRRLIDFCASSECSARLIFVSSVSAAQDWDVSKGPVPEEPLSDPALSVSTGYGSSKFVGENLLARAAERGLSCMSLRVGQVCGSASTGAWGTSEWVPILVKSSIAMGKLPELDGVVSWIPMDAVANVVKDVVLSEDKLPALINAVHPRPVPWKQVVEDINLCLYDRPLNVVPYGVWLEELERAASNATTEDLERIPALKLLDYFRAFGVDRRRLYDVPEDVVLEAGGFSTYDNSKLRTLCPSVQKLSQINERHARAWIGYWRRAGFLN